MLQLNSYPSIEIVRRLPNNGSERAPINQIRSVLKKQRNVQGSAPKPVKRKLVGLLKGSFLKVAKLGAASRFVESLFMWCDVADKELIAQLLAEHLTELKVRAPLCSALLVLYSW